MSHVPRIPVFPEYTAALPDLDKASSLFLRESFTPESNNNLSLLLGYYAQWFTHQFFNTNPEDVRKVNQPVGINLINLYGSTPEFEKSIRAYKDGLLKSTERNGFEFPEIIPAKGSVRGKEMFNVPIPLANLIPGFAAIHILFFRRHQYVAGKLAEHSKKACLDWDDEEIFQRTKIILTINLIRITMHDYVARALQSTHLKIRFDQNVKSSAMWKLFGPGKFPPINAIQIEFNFLYRWHQLYPEKIKVIDSLPLEDPKELAKLEQDIAKYKTTDLEFPDPDQSLGEKWNSVSSLADQENGMERFLFSASCSRAGKLELLNSNKWLVKNVIKRSLAKSREYQLASYNDYREHFGFGRMKSFEDVTSNPTLLAKLKEVYTDVDQIEYYPGVFAEEKDFGGIHGPFLATIGVAMTFSGIFASRLFENDIINPKYLTDVGMKLADELDSIQGLSARHSRLGDAPLRFTLPGDMTLEQGQ